MSVLGYEHKGAAPPMTPRKMCKATFKNPASITAGTGWFQQTKPDALE